MTPGWARWFQRYTRCSALHHYACARTSLKSCICVNFLYDTFYRIGGAQAARPPYLMQGEPGCSSSTTSTASPDSSTFAMPESVEATRAMPVSHVAQR